MITPHTYEGFDPKSPESYIMFTLMQNIFLEAEYQPGFENSKPV